MDVEIIFATPNPIDIISKAAGTSYGKTDASFKRLKHCFDNGHMSVFEHAGATFYISGISRACSHQLVRHRMASFVQESQRYTKVDTDKDDWYVIPESFKDNGMTLLFRECMYDCALDYQQALKHGVKPEDARYLLPEATKTNITMTANCRELFHFFDLRCDQAAQWEIRDLANEMKTCLRSWSEEWERLIDLYDLKGEEQ